jgi:hypothetical protein
MGIGIMGGRLGSHYGRMNSEGQIRRVTFIRNWNAGVDLGSFNALDWWIWDSHFVDCARGVTNLFSVDESGPTRGAGAFYVYRSLFERSTVADIDFANTGWFSLHNNTSSESRRFLQAEGIGANGAAVIMQKNTILDTTDPIAIDDGNLGPLMLIDNDVRSAPGHSGPVVRMDDWIGARDLVSIGNRYTVASPFSFTATADGKADRIIASSDQIVAPNQISSNLPALPQAPSRSNRKVFEVASAASAAAIQSAIDAAAASSAVNPVVHLPAGDYSIDRTIVVPAQARLQIAGDGLMTELMSVASLSGPILRLLGPSYATIRDFGMVNSGAQVQAIEVTRADQPGGLILIEGSSPGYLRATSLAQTQIAMMATPGFAGMNLSGVKSLVSIGSGGGPTVASDSNVLVSDTWYEGTETDLYRISSGNFTFMGGLLAPASHPGATVTSLSDPTVLLDGFVGQATFIGAEFSLNGLRSKIGIQIGAETAATNAMFLGTLSFSPNDFNRVSSGGSAGLVLPRTYDTTNGSVQTPTQGLASPAFILQSLQQARSLTWDTQPYSPPPGSTDVRIYRVKADQTLGMSISAN